MKRVFDVVASFVFLIAFSPVIALLAIIVKATSPGGAFYKQLRMGKGGKPFLICKIRTMINKADQVGPLFTTVNDSRITFIGRFLRKAKLDELPQLWNVLKGDMSLVGPRPEPVRLLREYPMSEECRNAIWSVRPGMTGLSQLKLLPAEEILNCSWDELLRNRHRIDLEYIKNRSFLGDVLICLRTILGILRKYLEGGEAMKIVSNVLVFFERLFGFHCPECKSTDVTPGDVEYSPRTGLLLVKTVHLHCNQCGMDSVVPQADLDLWPLSR